MVIFTCEDQFDAMMSCVYEAWASRLGHRNVRLLTEPFGTRELFCEYRYVRTDFVRAESVIRTIQKKISLEAYRMVYRAAMAEKEEKLDMIYRFLISGFHCGARVVHHLGEPSVANLFMLDRKVKNEAHHFREFLRFTERENRVLVGRISPKSNVITLLAPHFADRLPSEDWMIIDDTRRTAVVHPADRDYYLTSLSEEEFAFLTCEKEDDMERLWKEFFRIIGIEERKNPECQRNLMPLWYRQHMPELRP